MENTTTLKLSNNKIIAKISENISNNDNDEFIYASTIRFIINYGQLYLHSIGIYDSEEDMYNNNNNLAAKSYVSFIANTGVYSYENNKEKFITDNTIENWPMGYTYHSKNQSDKYYNDKYDIFFGTIKKVKYIRFPDYMHNGSQILLMSIQYSSDNKNFHTLKGYNINNKNITTENSGLFNTYSSNPQKVDNMYWKLEKKK